MYRRLTGFWSLYSEWMWRLYWPNFSHFKQVGGKKLIKGTKWTKEIAKYCTICVFLTLIVAFGLNKRPLIAQIFQRASTSLSLLKRAVMSIVS